MGATEQKPPAGGATELDHGAIGFVDALVIGLASTAPAYSLAAVIGTVTVIVGVHAPAVVGTASERPLTGAILGSVPHKLLHQSKIPVLVVPAG